MATSKWASSLANIEARVRRSLGIAGPIDLALGTPPVLTPVIIADDLTRPGCVATDFRGRRWRMALSTATIAAANRGCVFFVCSGLNSTVGNQDRGGVVIDTIEIQWTTPGAVAERILTEMRMSVQFETQPAVSIRDGFMVDPIGAAGTPGTAELAPMFSGSSNTVAAAGFGNRIWELSIVNGGGAQSTPNYVQLNFANMFLREQGYIVIGNVNNLANSGELRVNVSGRVF